MLRPRRPFRLATIATIVSAILCGLSLVLFPVTYRLTLAEFDRERGGVVAPNSVAITSHAKFSLYRGGIWFFSLDVPYTGSIRFLGDEHGIYYEGGDARIVRERSWRIGKSGFLQQSYIGEKNEFVGRDWGADFPGIYYRHFVWWDDELPWWTLRVSLWYPIALFAILPLCWLIRRRGRLLAKTTPDKDAAEKRRPAREPGG